MKKVIIISMFVTSFAITFSACNNSTTKKSDVESSTVASATYTCPMHSEVIKNEPGDCPICGMELVKMEATDTVHMGDHNGQMHMDADSMAN